MHSTRHAISPATNRTLSQSRITLSWLTLIFVGLRWDNLSGQTVPSPSPETGAVPARVFLQTQHIDSLAQESCLDSLSLALLRIEIAKAQERATETNFWRRLIPHANVSASFGMHDIVFVDPTNYVPYILPRDAYRLTVSLSLSDLFNFSTHTQAVLELQRLQTEMTYQKVQKAQSRRSLEEQLSALQDQLVSIEGEMTIIQDLLRFNQLRFQQGKIEFDALARSKLELSAASRSIQQLRHQEALIKLKLSYQ
jgi:hypothetical protein